MSLIPFPNVPNVPGVPVILRSITVPTAGQLLNMALGAAAEAVFGKVVWGVFDQSGKEALTPDSFLDIDYKNESRVANYPQEAGAFAAYNKVGTPYDCRVKMALGGDKASRTAFLAKVEAMLGSIDLFTVVTPEATYTNATLQNYSYRRESKNGASMLTVELWFIQVRLTGAATFSKPAPNQPSGADPVSDGQVQTSPVTQGTVTAITLPALTAARVAASTGGATGSWAPSTGGATGSW